MGSTPILPIKVTITIGTMLKILRGRILVSVRVNKALDFALFLTPICARIIFLGHRTN